MLLFKGRRYGSIEEDLLISVVKYTKVTFTNVLEFIRVVLTLPLLLLVKSITINTTLFLTILITISLLNYRTFTKVFSFIILNIFLNFINFTLSPAYFIVITLYFLFIFNISY